MEASEAITASDLHGKPIIIGSTVRYITTRTTGKVTDLKREGQKVMARIDASGLYYDTHYLELTTMQRSNIDDEESVKIDYEELEKKIKEMEESISIKDVMTDSSCEGGG
jgi:hypothetical protein